MEERHYGPLYSTNTKNYKPTTATEEEDDSDWQHGSNSGERKTKIKAFERFEKNRGISQAGSRHLPFDRVDYQPSCNVSTKINKREYSAYALDSMQEGGFMYAFTGGRLL